MNKNKYDTNDDFFMTRLTKWLVNFFIKLLLFIIFLTVLQVVIFKYCNPTMTVRMIADYIQCSFNDRSYIEPEYNWVDLNEISPDLRQAVLASEDQRFLSHSGFDFIEIKNSIIGIFQYKKIRGASTISMQTARTVFLFPDRTITRKLLEAYFTILIELIWSKPRILEVYLNTVDWGHGIMGAQAASKKYFNKNANDLSETQAALLVAILPRPHKLSPQKPGLRVLKRKDRILKIIKNMPLLEH